MDFEDFRNIVGMHLDGMDNDEHGFALFMFDDAGASVNLIVHGQVEEVDCFYLDPDEVEGSMGVITAASVVKCEDSVMYKINVNEDWVSFTFVEEPAMWTI